MQHYFATSWESVPGFSRIFPLIGTLSNILMAKGKMLGVAESCTGGLLAACCTEVPGSSSWFAGGIVAYANTVKIQTLHVPEHILASAGAVSQETVTSMAVGTLNALHVDIAVAVSGIAGPTGGSLDKPVGTVWIGGAALQTVGNPPRLLAQQELFSGSRIEVRIQAVVSCLEMAIELATGK